MPSYNPYYNFESYTIGATVIVSAVTRTTSTGALANPGTSMQVRIDRLTGGTSTIVAATNMTNDSTGLYHYDFASAAYAVGRYEAVCIATDGGRVSTSSTLFELE